MKTKGWNEEVALKQTFKIIKMKLEQGREITKAIAKYREALSETPTQEEVETVEQYYQKQGLEPIKKKIMQMKTAIEKENSRNKNPTQGKRRKT